jgi:pimeloyl-ACP methyl ester carboxylesterase
MTTILAKDLRWGCPDGRPSIFGLAGQLSAVARHYVSYARLKRMKAVLGAQGTPILIIVSSEDSLIRVHNSVLLRDILDCNIVKVDLSGHMLHYQIPAAFNNVLQTHFDAAPPEPNTSAPISPAPVLPLAKL